MIQDGWEDDVVVWLDVQRCDHIQLILDEQGGLASRFREESEVQSVVNDHVAVVLSENDLDVLHVQLELQGNIWTKLIEEDWNLMLHTWGIELQIVLLEGFVDAVLIEVSPADAGVSHGVGDASSSWFGDHQLGECIWIHEVHVIRLDHTLVVRMHNLSEEEKVRIAFLNIWTVGVPVVQSAFVRSSLTLDRMWKLDVHLVVVEYRVHDWAEHVAEDILSSPPWRIFNDNHGVVDCLMHEECQNYVVVVQVRVTEFELAAPYDWVEVAMLIEF